MVTLGVREGERVGVDLRSYAVGPSFQGFKMIPPSCTHLLTFGESERLVGMFLTLPPGGVSVLEYDPTTELPAPLPASPKLDGIAHSVRRMEWDARLGPYPIATSAQWDSLSSQITGGVLERAGIPFGSLVLPGGIDDDSLTCDNGVVPFHASLPRVPTFVQLDARARCAGAGCAQWRLSLLSARREAEWER